MTDKPKQLENLNPKEVFYSMAELKPLLTEWAIGIIGHKRGGGSKPRGPTNFPDIIATKPNGEETTVEDMLRDAGIVPMIPFRIPTNPVNPAPPKTISIKDLSLFVNIQLNKPKWISQFLWDKEFVQKIFRWFVKNNTTITVVNKEDLEERIAYDSNKPK